MNAFRADSVIIFIPDVGPVLLQRSVRAKRMSITIKPFKGIRVAVPRGVSFAMAAQMAHAKSAWMKNHCARMKELEKHCEAAAANKVQVDRDEAGKILTERLAAIARKHGYRYNRVSIRNQKTRWGSCSSRNNISLNMKLTLLPDELRDYIILHELVHTRVKNHGPDFWQEMLRVEPDAESLDRRMKEQCILLL